VDYTSFAGVIFESTLIELCSVSADDPVYPAAMGFCLGYIDAAMDYHAALTAGPKYDPIACPETAVTREQVVVVLMDWSKRNAQHLNSEAPVVGVMRASAAKWPCSK
jgi:gamma-glutamyl phosphate reductase